MGQTPSNTARHDNASTRTLHSSSINSSRPMSFLRRISRRLHTHPNRRFGRQRTTGPATVTSVAPSMTSSVRRATVAATHAAAAATGPVPPLPFLHIDPHPSNSSAASTTSAISNASDISQIISEIISSVMLSSLSSDDANNNNNNNNNHSTNGVLVHDGTSFLRYMQMPIRSQQQSPTDGRSSSSPTLPPSSSSSATSGQQTVVPIFIVGYRTGTVDSHTHSNQVNTTTATSPTNSTTNIDSNGNVSPPSAPQSHPPPPSIPTYIPVSHHLRRPHSAISTSSSLATLQSMPLSVQSNRTNHTHHTTHTSQANLHTQQQQQQQQQQHQHQSSTVSLSSIQQMPLPPLPPPSSQSSQQQQRESLSSSAASTRSNTSITTVGNGGGRWLIYVLNGQHHHHHHHHHHQQATNILPNHILSQHPALARLSDNPSYEDLLWLANMLGPARPVTTTQQAIDAALPIHSWSDETTKRTMLQDTERCLVCLDDFIPKQSVRVLKCRHVFHVECVDRWLVESHNSCPVCRGVPVTNPTPAMT